MRTRDEIEALLREPLERGKIRQRPDGVWYIAAHDVERRLNEVFGLGWTQEIKSVDLVSCASRAGGKGNVWVACYRVLLRLTVLLEMGGVIFRDGVSCSYGRPQATAEDAHDQGLKSAATDALKRAAKTLGDSLGLALYVDPAEALAEGYVVDVLPGGRAVQSPVAPPPTPAAPAAALPVPPHYAGEYGELAKQLFEINPEGTMTDGGAEFWDIMPPAYRAALDGLRGCRPEGAVPPVVRDAVRAALEMDNAHLRELYARANHGEVPDPRHTRAVDLMRCLVASDVAFFREAMGHAS